MSYFFDKIYNLILLNAMLSMVVACIRERHCAAASSLLHALASVTAVHILNEVLDFKIH